MSGRGRPLRFLALVSVGWVGARVAILWSQTGSLPAAIEALTSPSAAPASRPAPAKLAPPPRLPLQAARPVRFVATLPAQMLRRPAAITPDRDRIELALLGLVQFGSPETTPDPPIAALPILALPAPDRIDSLPDRWSASGWAVVRSGAGLGAAPGGSQLGGSQMGARLAWLAVPRARIALYGRVTAPLRGKGREAALGVEWQPTRAPVRLVAEQRFGLDGTPGGPGMGVVGGIDTQLAGFRLEAYGQAGAIARNRAEPYADGAARLSRELTGDRRARLALGIGIWGGAQRDAQRLDIGPSATLSAGRLRVSLDWRQRVAGRARPGSGIALTLGGDF